MRTVFEHWPIVLFALASWVGCGGGLADGRVEPTAREDEELRARHWHEQVVELESETALAAERGEDCVRTQALAARACELATEICALARADERDEGTAMLCEDAEPRCASARSMALTHCGPRSNAADHAPAAEASVR